MLFPVGHLDYEFLCEAVILIVDTVGDYYNLTAEVTVTLPDGEKIDICNGLLTDKTDGPIPSLIQQAKYQEAAGMIFSVASQLNVPAMWVSIISKFKCSIEQAFCNYYKG